VFKKKGITTEKEVLKLGHTCTWLNVFSYLKGSAPYFQELLCVGLNVSSLVVVEYSYFNCTPIRHIIQCCIQVLSEWSFLQGEWVHMKT